VLIGSVVVGILIVVVVAASQLGGKFTGTLKDPGLSYPAALLDGQALGKAAAPVTVDVYEDFQCPYCAQYSLSVEPIIVSDLVSPGMARIVHHDFVFLDRTASQYESRLSAVGAYCADQQGKYWNYAHWVYANQDGENLGGFRRERLVAIAAAAGVDEGSFSTCLDSQAATAFVMATTTKANSMRITGTPSIFANGTPWAGSSLQASSIESLIRSELAKASASPTPSGSASPVPSASAAP
jgi:protein-disulfide isomerase